jgi:hypothetical protein
MHGAKKLAAAAGLGTLTFSAFALASPVQQTIPVGPPVRQISPIVVDVENDGFALTSLADGVSFDLDESGIPEPCAWTSPYDDDAFLVHDDNGNGIVDGAFELFADNSGAGAQPPSVAFDELSTYDTNGNGRIDAQDRDFHKLKLWYDVNHNGVSDHNGVSPTFVWMSPEEAAGVGYPYFAAMREVQPLSAKVRFIDLARDDYEYFDPHGNWFRYSTRAARSTGTYPLNLVPVYDVYFVVGPE